MTLASEVHVPAPDVTLAHWVRHVTQEQETPFFGFPMPTIAARLYLSCRGVQLPQPFPNWAINRFGMINVIHGIKYTNSRNGRTRTDNPVTPSHVRYQIALHSDEFVPTLCKDYRIREDKD